MISRAELERVIKHSLQMNSSPTTGRGDIHGGQRGYIVYERDGVPYIVADILRAVYGGDE